MIYPKMNCEYCKKEIEQKCTFQRFCSKCGNIYHNIISNLKNARSDERRDHWSKTKLEFESKLTGK